MYALKLAEEKRACPRATPLRNIEVTYETAIGRFNGILKDISEVAMAVQLGEENIFNLGGNGAYGTASFGLDGETMQISVWVYRFSKDGTVVLWFLNAKGTEYGNKIKEYAGG